MKIRTKIALYLGPFILIVICAIFVLNYYLVRNALIANAQEELAKTQQNMHRAAHSLLSTAISNYLRGITEKNLDFIETQHADYLKGRVSEADAKANIQQHFDLQPVGDSGYLVAVEEKANGLYLDLHPFLPKNECTETEGCQAWAETRNGYTEYGWKNPLDNSSRKKAAYVAEFAPWNWIVGASSYRDEFVELVRIEDLRQLISPVRINESGYFFVFDANNRLLIHPEVEDLSGNGLVNSKGENIMELLRESEDGYLTYLWKNPSEQEERLKYAFIDNLEDYNWYLVATGYLSEVYEPIEFLKQLTLLMVLVTVAILSVIIFKLSRNISVPLHNLKNSIDVFYKEKTGLHWQGNPLDEINVLGNAFSQMTEELDRTMAALEEKNVELAHSEKRIEENRIYLDSIINSMPSIIIGVNPQLIVTQWNSAAVEATGLKREQASGTGLFSVFNELEQHRHVIEESLATSRVKTFSYTRNVDGKNKAFHAVTTYPLIGKTGEGAVIRIDDITERVEMELRLRHSQKMDAVGQLAGGIAHDFNNMLSGIIGAAELLQTKVRDEDQKLVKIIREASGRTAELIQKLLTFSRKDAIAFSPVNVHTVILNTCEILKRSIDKRIQVETRLRAKSAMVNGDWSQLQNSLLNIGINGGHAMPDGGTLTFSTTHITFDDSFQTDTTVELQPGTYLQIEVRDTGCGIAEEDLKNIFEPFFTTKQQSEGTGLGLAAVYGAVQQHHGAITVSSQLAKGTIFSIYLPLIEAEEQSILEDEALLTGQGGVLIVDDEPVVRATAKMMLEKLGYSTLMAENGQQGLEVYQQHLEKIDLVLLDVIMPVMDGTECFYRLKKINPDVKVVISSGFTRDADLNGLKDNGLLDFVRKPYSLEQLSQVVAKAMQAEKLKKN
ncbi:MAG: cache domain-containing protein [Desulfocapsaceae bacterium]|nr:cache domain-containing protein [Desulfocapsaceae bacterium]